MAKSYSVTSAGVNPADDRAHRMRMYFIAMSLRMACIVSLFWVRGWWVLLVAAGAVFLPWFAVLVANAAAHGGEEAPDAPELLRIEGQSMSEPEDMNSDTLLVVDVVPERRSTTASEAHNMGVSDPGENSSESGQDVTDRALSEQAPNEEFVFQQSPSVIEPESPNPGASS